MTDRRRSRRARDPHGAPCPRREEIATVHPTTAAGEPDTSPTSSERGGEDPPAQQHSGRWDPVLDMPNVAVHAHLLPNGKVLFWGRRDDPGGSMHEHTCTP